MEKIKKIAALLLLFGWMGLIFSFSGQRAEVSGELSGSVSYRIVDSVNQLFGSSMEKQKIENAAELLDYPVRKAAHMTEYAILALLFLNNFIRYPMMGKRCFLLSELAAVSYAATDEFHQLFVAGRSGQLTDVCIDGVGAGLGLILFYLLRRLWLRRGGGRCRL